MASKLWFKRKTYGWGWTPSCGAGWVVILIYCLAMGVYPAVCRWRGWQFSLPIFLVVTFLLSGALFAVCWWKGESPEWRWGDD